MMNPRGPPSSSSFPSRKDDTTTTTDNNNNQQQHQQHSYQYHQHQQKRTSSSLSSSSSQQQPTIYKPSIYSYTCRGAYHAYSDFRGGGVGGSSVFGSSSSTNKNTNATSTTTTTNNNNNTPKNSEGICHGFRTRLKLLHDMEPDTRRGALKRFTALTDYDLDDDDDNNNNYQNGDDKGISNSASNNPSLPLSQRTQSILVSPALIFRDEDLLSSSNDTNKKDDDNDNNNKKNQLNTSKKYDEILPEEEIIKYQQWSCYGSTDVDYLVLKDIQTGQQKIAAVAPRNDGLSIRKVKTTERSNITQIGFFRLNIVIAEDDVSYDDNDIEATQSRLQRNNTINTNDTNSILTNKTLDKIQNEQIINSREEVPPKPSLASLENAKKAIMITTKFSYKVWDHMQMNVLWLYNNVQDDFINRTYIAGNKIIHQIPKTVEGTSIYLNKLVRKLIEDNTNWNNNNNNGKKPPEK